MAILTPHLAFPLRVVGGRSVAVEQGSPRHLSDQAEVVLRTYPGVIEHAPDLGLRDLVARSKPGAPEVLRALGAHVLGDFDVTDESFAERVRNVSVGLRQEEA